MGHQAPQRTKIGFGAVIGKIRYSGHIHTGIATNLLGITAFFETGAKHLSPVWIKVFSVFDEKFRYTVI